MNLDEKKSDTFKWLVSMSTIEADPNENLDQLIVVPFIISSITLKE